MSRIEPLEPRRLLSAVYPTAVEQYLVELVNRARANPAAEAKRYGISLNEGLAPGTLSTAAKQPLACNPRLLDAARLHSRWILANISFTHGEKPGPFFRGIGSSDRMKAAGYDVELAGEAMAMIGPQGSLYASANEQHRLYIVDPGVRQREHRLTLLDGDFKEVGAGETVGVFRKNLGGLSAGTVNLAVEEFGYRGSTSYLTGVAYKDKVIGDHFYTPGEGLGNIVVKAVRLSDKKVFSTKTYAAGGYSLALPPGTYTVTGRGSGLSAPIVFSRVTIGAKNVKRDFVA